MSKVVEGQGGQDEDEPSGLYRLPAEVAEIGIQRLGAGHRKKHGAEGDEADETMIDQEVGGMDRVQRQQNAGIRGDLHDAGNRDRERTKAW